MNVRNLVSLGVLAGIMFCLRIHQAYASTVWNKAAITCTPNPASLSLITDGPYASGSDVSFASGASGNIYLYCNIDTTTPNIASLSVTYQDTDGAALGVFGFLTVYKVSKSDGTVSSLLSGFTTSSTSWTSQDYVFGPTTLDFVHYSYYVLIWLHRDSNKLSDNIHVASVSLNY